MNIEKRVKDLVEEKIAESVNNKIRTIGELNTGDKADNLFLFEVYHEYKNNDVKDINKVDEKKIEVILNRQTSIITVIVPSYMREIFEHDIPPQVVSEMKQSEGGVYEFPIKFSLRIKSYLELINR